jgi:transforming growth factor-beta-induced protein
MENKKYLILTLGICCILLGAFFCGCVEEEPKDETKNIVETATENADFNTLVDAIIAADLDETLSDETNEFTVFAPTDDAFAKLDSAYLTNLVENDITTLTKILTYHVISGVVMSTDLSDGMQAETVQGKYLEISIDDGTVYINDAMVILADIECNNGIIHVIDTVLVPKDNIVETAIANDDFNTLVEAVVTAGLDTTLSDESEQYTVFAPVDDAFAKLDSATLNNLLNNDTANLTKILTYHVVSGIVLSTDLSDNMTAPTVEGSNITIQIDNETVYINDAKVILADIECSNGIIHVIDKVLIP